MANPDAVYFVQNIVDDALAVCRCGCKAFWQKPLGQEEIFVCIYCYSTLSIYNTGEFVIKETVPEDLVELVDTVQKNRTRFVTRNGTMGHGHYSEDNDSFSIAEVIYKAGFRKVKD